MIHIEFSQAVSLLISSVISLVLVFWMFYNYKEEGTKEELKYIQQCPYCTHVFLNYKLSGQLQKCPNCKSYIEIKHKETGQ